MPGCCEESCRQVSLIAADMPPSSLPSRPPRRPARYRFTGSKLIRLQDPYLLGEVNDALDLRDPTSSAEQLLWRAALVRTDALRSRFTHRGRRYQCKDRDWWSLADQEVVERFAAQYLAGVPLAPILLLDFEHRYGLWIPDGAHRTAGALLAGVPEIRSLVCFISI